MSTTTPPRRRVGAYLTAFALAVGAVAIPSGAASAAESPAPAPEQNRVIAGIHTDAVSTFLDEGRLVLGAKADVPEGNGTRFAAEDIWFHLEDSAQMAVPAGYEFIAPAGSPAWIAPESNPGSEKLWPGFSTESIAPGAVEGDKTTFTLEGVNGPGELELFVGGGLGGPKRLWSSDDAGFTSFEVGRTHMHANWAFTAPGTYEVAVQGAATVAGQRQTSSATYTFVVGDLPSAVETTTSLTARTSTAVLGDSVTLDAAVQPATATGYVEFLDGETVLGHEPVASGRSSFTVKDLPLGSRSYTARFVPLVANVAVASVSSPATVTVTEEVDGQEFGIYGLAESYAAGEAIDLRAGGATLKVGQRWQWLLRAGENETAYAADDGLRGPDDSSITRDATVAFNGAQVSLRIVGKEGLVQQTAWYTINVTGTNVGQGKNIDVSAIGESYYRGDVIEVSIVHEPLAVGETGRWVERPLPFSGNWYPSEPTMTGENVYLLDSEVLAFSEYAYETLDAEGTVTGRSAAISTEMNERELQLSGIQSVYRAGDTLTATTELYPAREGVAYQWWLASSAKPRVPIANGTTASIELPITSDLHRAMVTVEATDAVTGDSVSSVSQRLIVTDVAPGEQLLLIDSLSGHYHQGGPIRLNAVADPLASDTDTYQWMWQRPDQTAFVEIAGATSATHEVQAEQALDGTTVKVELRSAAGSVLATSETATIHVDDHGAPPQQKATISGLAPQYVSDDEITVTAAVAPASVLTRWNWYVQKAGETTPMLVADQHGPELAFAAKAEYDGATVHAVLSFDDGTSYVASAPVIIHIEDREQPGTDPGEQPDGTAPPTSAPAVPGASELDGTDAGGIVLSASTAKQGQVITAQLGAANATQWVSAWMFSTPTALGNGWTQADTTGTIAVAIPANAAVGEHRIAAFTAGGTLIGWAELTVLAADGATASGTLPATGSSIEPGWLVTAGLLIAAGIASVLLAHRRRATTPS